MMQALKVLIVEDSPDDADLVLAELRRAGYAPEWKRVETQEDFLIEIARNPEIILSDYSMPQFTGFKAVQLLQQSGLDIPFILISGTVGEENAVEAMRLGVTDYLLKDRLARLGAAVRRALQEVEERAERYKLEAQFIESQKMEVLGQLAGGVAHDFNNLLAIIIGYSDLMAAQIGPEGVLKKYIGEIRHASERAVGLTRQLLVFSRKQKVELVVLELNKTVEELKDLLRRVVDENIDMQIIPGKKPGYIKADSGYLGQVLMNLVVNARDAMPHGGKITISIENRVWTDATMATHSGPGPGRYVMLSVSDTGCGMTEEVKARLFEAFFTTKAEGKGTGLGLATCRKIIQQSGAAICVESEPGKGATFRIYFPQVEGNPGPVSPRNVEARQLPVGTETLLVVEDESSVRHLARSVLEASGYEVITAKNGQDALRVAREHKGAPIGLVITDVVMPLMGGKVMAEWLRTLYPGIRVLFTSGYTDDAIAHHGVLEESVAFLAKPYTPAMLVRRVREMLDERVQSGTEAGKGDSGASSAAS